MFDRYTEKARRTVFWARHEASELGSQYIEAEHLLLGLLRDSDFVSRFLAHVDTSAIREQVAAHRPAGERIPTSVDMPVSGECQRVLAHAAEESEQLSHKHIGNEHLLLGLLRENQSLAAELVRQRGLELAAVRQQIAQETS